MTDLSVIVFSKADVNRRYSSCYYDLEMNGGGGRREVASVVADGLEV